jgi:hypothetical protein
MATTKKPTTTKKPAAKKTAVVKAHRGMAHVPRGRRRPIGTPQLPRNPRRRPEVEPRRPGDDRPQMPRGRQMTPAMRRRLMEMRRRAQQRRQLPPQQPRGRAVPLQAQTPAQQKAAQDRFKKMMEAQAKMRANVFGRGRKPTQATQTPKVATPRKRPTGTPRGPQVSPRKRNFRFRGRRT